MRFEEELSQTFASLSPEETAQLLANLNCGTEPDANASQRNTRIAEAVMARVQAETQAAAPQPIASTARRAPRIRHFSAWMAIAACLCVVLVAALIWHRMEPPSIPPDTSAAVTSTTTTNEEVDSPTTSLPTALDPSVTTPSANSNHTPPVETVTGTVVTSTPTFTDDASNAVTTTATHPTSQIVTERSSQTTVTIISTRTQPTTTLQTPHSVHSTTPEINSGGSGSHNSATMPSTIQSGFEQTDDDEGTSWECTTLPMPDTTEETTDYTECMETLDTTCVSWAYMRPQPLLVSHIWIQLPIG